MPYVPGWDTHGLPIEHQVLKTGKVRRSEVSALGSVDIAVNLPCGILIFSVNSSNGWECAVIGTTLILL